MDSSLTDWIARGNVITKTVVVGNTSLAVFTIPSLIYIV